MQLIVACLLGTILVVAATVKLAHPRTTQAALETFGVPAGRRRWFAWAALATAELALAAGIVLRPDVAAYPAALLLVTFAGALWAALRAGRAGLPCACFGTGSRVSRLAVGRNLALAVVCVALPSIPDGRPSRDALVVGGLAIALAGLALLALVTVALAREVGALRLRLPPVGALEIPEEGPPLEERSALLERFQLDRPVRFALAVFSSEGCRVCRTLAPAVRALERDPILAVRVFDERRDADAWTAANIPGSPFAVALDRSGTVRAKGTFNTLAQLESILAAAERRTPAPVGA